MPAAATCRFGLYLGIKSVSYVKLERQGADWRLASSGELEWHDVSSTPEQCQDELLALLQKLMKQEGIGREPAHVSLHSRLCVTRVTTGNRQQVDEQLAEIIDNSQHYLQLGLGDKLIGHTAVPIDESRQYGQVAIIKRGLIETLENATGQAGLELLAVDGALTSICRLAQLAELDRSPLLLVWLGASGAEIGISYQGHLQLNYHAGESLTVEQAAETVGKHLKRLRRFCDRYRQVDCHSDLKRVLVLASPHESDALRMLLQALQFEQVYTLSDLPGTVLGDHLGHTPLTAPGVACALGGLLVHHASQTMPTTDVYSQYLRSKPQPLGRVLLRDGWPLLVSAALLLGVLCSGWSLAMWVAHEESQTATLNSSFD
ncbi:MAG: hypothetical protein KDA45_15475, partial [Planctomycetales bacterium]|nr:hypothetical protein [Planctomycetales bacterium]